MSTTTTHLFPQEPTLLDLAIDQIRVAFSNGARSVNLVADGEIIGTLLNPFIAPKSHTSPLDSNQSEISLADWCKPEHAIPNKTEREHISVGVSAAAINAALLKVSNEGDCEKKKSFFENKPHNHYFKPCPYDYVDVYRVLTLFKVTDPCIGHAAKKLLVAGGRGAGKNIDQDIQEAIDSLKRWQEMRLEEANPIEATEDKA
jgi:hypothetical protein